MNNEGIETSTYIISKMDCPTEEKLIRAKLGSNPKIKSLEFNLLARKLTINHEPGISPWIAQALKEIDLEPDQKNKQTTATDIKSAKIKKWAFLSLSGIFAASSEVISFTGQTEQSLFVVGSAVLAIAFGGYKVFKKGFISLKNLTLNINALMSIAVVGAMTIGEWPEAAMVIFLFALAEEIESYSLAKAKAAVQKLLELAPDTTNIIVDKQVEKVATETVAKKSIIRVFPGEKIPLDGKIVLGSSYINQSQLTGESAPVSKTVGDSVVAGSVNQDATLDIETTSDAQDSTVAKISRIVENAQADKAIYERFVDRFSKIYTPAIVIFSLGMAILGPFLFPHKEEFYWIYKALTLLVIACPCALVISTPVTIVSALSGAARKGILVKGGSYLEVARKITLMAFDKTGTITRGRPEVTDFATLSKEMGEKNILTYARQLAFGSSHPLSQAIVRYNKEDINSKALEAPPLENIPGKGVSGEIEGRKYFLASHKLAHELGICSKEIEEQLFSFEKQGKTVVVFTTENQVLALFACLDEMRKESPEAISRLHGMSVKTVILSGDNPNTVAIIAGKAGIDEYKAQLLPEEKLSFIKDQISKNKQVVAMVGDGINDAPALAASSLGIAMGVAGSDIAIETADIALMDDDLLKLPWLIKLSKKTSLVLMENITLALGIKVIFLVLTLLNFATLWMAVFADMGASLIVVANGLRLRSKE